MRTASVLLPIALASVLVFTSIAGAWEPLVWEEDFTLDPTRDAGARPTWMAAEPGKWTWDPSVIHDGLLHLPLSTDGWDPVDCMPYNDYDAPRILMDVEFRSISTSGNGPGIYFYLDMADSTANPGGTIFGMVRLVATLHDNGTPSNPDDDFQRFWYGGDDASNVWGAPYLLADNLSTGFLKIEADVNTVTDHVDLLLTDLGDPQRSPIGTSLDYVRHDAPASWNIARRFHFSPQMTDSQWDYVRVQLVPEPATLVLLAAGGATLLRKRRR